MSIHTMACTQFMYIVAYCMCTPCLGRYVHCVYTLCRQVHHCVYTTYRQVHHCMLHTLLDFWVVAAAGLLSPTSRWPERRRLAVDTEHNDFKSENGNTCYYMTQKLHPGHTTCKALASAIQYHTFEPHFPVEIACSQRDAKSDKTTHWTTGLPLNP